MCLIIVVTNTNEPLHLHHVIAQSLKHWLLTVEAQSSLCGICGGQSGTSIGFSLCKHISFPVIILPCSLGLLICLSFAVLYLFIYLFTAIGFPPSDSGQYTCIWIGKRQHKRKNNIQNNTKLIRKHRVH